MGFNSVFKGLMTLWKICGESLPCQYAREKTEKLALPAVRITSLVTKHSQHQQMSQTRTVKAARKHLYQTYCAEEHLESVTWLPSFSKRTKHYLKNNATDSLFTCYVHTRYLTHTQLGQPSEWILMNRTEGAVYCFTCKVFVWAHHLSHAGSITWNSRFDPHPGSRSKRALGSWPWGTPKPPIRR
jgi:hypothetical protein